MRQWFGSRKKNRVNIATPEQSILDSNVLATKHQKVSSGVDLLSLETNARLVSSINRSLSITKEAWDAHYLFALERFAELVQTLPASRNHHHSTSGGLLTHTLEVLLTSIRLSSGVILPPGAEPEDILHNAERWRFGIFVCALLHDIGKIISDQEVVYRVKGKDFSMWQPWHGAMPIGAEYTHRYRETKGNHIHGLHEKVGLTLLPFLLTPSASKWLTSDRALLGQMMNTLTASATGSGVVGDIIRKADRASTADNLSPETGVFEDGAKPLHVKILEALQTLANEGKMKRNMPGAGCWVTKDLTYIVAKSTMEKVREHLLAAGHKGIPQSPLRLMQILTEHKIALPSENSEIHQAIVNDEQRSWEQKLSFLIVPNEHIWISGLPNTFNGTITPVDAKGNEIELPEIESESYSLGGSAGDPLPKLNTETNIPNQSETSSEGGSPGDPLPKSNNESRSIVFRELEDSGDQAATKKPAIKRTGRSAIKAKPKTANSNTPTSLKNQHKFFEWLINGVRYRRIRSNESGASVHVIDGYIALITPKIFDLYLDDNKSQALSLGKNRDAQLTKLQRDVKDLGIHLRSPGGEDFHQLIVRGPKRESTVTAMLLKRELIPEFDTLSPNPILIFGEGD